MIGRLRGTLVVKQPPALMVDVGGVGYELEAPMSTFYELPEPGAEVVLHTHLVVRDDAHLLFGFHRESERALFRTLIRINGVGAKLALAILSGMSADELARAVAESDTAALVRLPGIGKKTAERLLVELRDKIDTAPLPASGVPAAEMAAARLAVADDPASEAASALVALGYKPQEASRMVARVEADGLGAEELIRRALKAAVSR